MRNITLGFTQPVFECFQGVWRRDLESISIHINTLMGGFTQMHHSHHAFLYFICGWKKDRDKNLLLVVRFELHDTKPMRRS